MLVQYRSITTSVDIILGSVYTMIHARAYMYAIQVYGVHVL